MQTRPTVTVSHHRLKSAVQFLAIINDVIQFLAITTDFIKFRTIINDVIQFRTIINDVIQFLAIINDVIQLPARTSAVGCAVIPKSGRGAFLGDQRFILASVNIYLVGLVYREIYWAAVMADTQYLTDSKILQQPLFNSQTVERRTIETGQAKIHRYSVNEDSNT